MRYPSHVTLGCQLLSPTFWEPNGLILSLVEGLFDGLPTRTKVYFVSSKCSFKYHLNTFLFMCGSKGKCLVTTTFAFRLFSSHFLTTLHSILRPMIAHLSCYQCGHTIDNLGTHLLWCPCGNERTTIHDTFWDTITIIILKNATHV